MCEYTKESIRELLLNNTKEQILSKHTKSQLVMMHQVTYGCNPRSALDKAGILSDLLRFFAGMERAEAFANMH